MPRTQRGESVLSRVVRIVEAFGPGDSALTITEIARRSGLHIATASRLVEELGSFGWLQRDEDRKVRIGVRMWELVSRASPTLSLREAAMPVMEDLHAIVGQHIQLGVMEGDEVLFVERLTARQGYALLAGHIHPDATGVAMPVRDPAGKVVAALAIIVPNDDTARSRIAVLQAASGAVSRAMLYPAPPLP
ncbi:helix-turn-helix domain-containing protein [Arthrobacter sp. LjRoot78]|uniref:IclR family transcriptional regulator n=1 Tax=Arthrobacter sp. LjRoot78 TaxID=3342338 RepID=UPI003ECCD068